jgi:hypothetical protein
VAAQRRRGGVSGLIGCALVVRRADWLTIVFLNRLSRVPYAIGVHKYALRSAEIIVRIHSVAGPVRILRVWHGAPNC